MKRRFLLPIALFSLLLSISVPAAVDYSSFKTADEFWNYLQKIREEPAEQPKSLDEANQMVMEWLDRLKGATDAFGKAFPQDPRRWSAALTGIRANAQLRRLSGKDGAADEDQKKIQEIIDSQDAPAPVKGEAAYAKVALTMTLDVTKPETFANFHKAVAEFLEKYPEDPMAVQLKQLELQVLNDEPTAEADKILKKYAEGSDARMAGAAKNVLEIRQKKAELLSKPLDLKFKDSEGKDVDFASLRGKVVLLDFWASWCGPCVAEMPNVVSAYKKLHDKGFEVVGISLDQDKEAMQGAMQKLQMTWSVYFEDGEENKIAKLFGVTAIPSAWLIDKKGMIRGSGFRGEALDAGVEKLLAE